MTQFERLMHSIDNDRRVPDRSELLSKRPPAVETRAVQRVSTTMDTTSATSENAHKPGRGCASDVIGAQKP